MAPIIVRPDHYRHFGSGAGSTFCLVTNTALREHFAIVTSDGYAASRIVSFDTDGTNQGGEVFDTLLEQVIPEPAHILVVSPYCFFQSPDPVKIGQRKLIAMPCNSTPTSLEAIAYILGVMERTDPDREQTWAEQFFARGQASERLDLVDETYGTYATFDHLQDSYEWHQQAGPLAWGEQQMAPSGELSVFPGDIMHFRDDLRLTITGEIAFKGQPIVHSGPPAYMPEDQARIYHALMCLDSHAVIATVRDGVILELRATHPAAAPAAKMLDTMLTTDSRYRLLQELGFGINTELELLPGNVGMNEPYGHTNGVVHWGLGLTPYTQYALTLLCLGTQVRGRGGEVLIGAPSPQP